MVMMISVTGGRAPRRRDGQPVQQQADGDRARSTATSAASGSGTPAADTNTVTMPPSMTNSPCAKFTTSEAL